MTTNMDEAVKLARDIVKEGEGFGERTPGEIVSIAFLSLHQSSMEARAEAASLPASIKNNMIVEHFDTATNVAGYLCTSCGAEALEECELEHDDACFYWAETAPHATAFLRSHEELNAELDKSLQDQANMLKNVEALVARIAELEGHMRTPGMTEKCPRCGGEWDGDWKDCPEYPNINAPLELCPIRRAKAAMERG